MLTSPDLTNSPSDFCLLCRCTFVYSMCKNWFCAFVCICVSSGCACLVPANTRLQPGCLSLVKPACADEAVGRGFADEGKPEGLFFLWICRWGACVNGRRLDVSVCHTLYCLYVLHREPDPQQIASVWCDLAAALFGAFTDKDIEKKREEPVRGKREGGKNG